MATENSTTATVRAVVGDTNGFRAKAALAHAALDPRVEEIEGGGCDDGRVFVHLRAGFWFGSTEGTSSRTVGSARELRDALAMIEHSPAKVWP